MPCSYPCIWAVKMFITVAILPVLSLFFVFFSCQSFLTMSERRSLRVRTPSNRAVQVAASSQPPKKLLRTRDPAQTGNPPDAAHSAGPPPLAQPSASALTVGPSAHAAEPPSSAYAGCPFNQELPVSPGIIDAIVQRVTNAVPQQRLASIRSTNMISTFPLLYPPCMKPLSRQNPMQYPGTKLVDQLT